MEENNKKDLKTPLLVIIIVVLLIMVIILAYLNMQKTVSNNKQNDIDLSQTKENVTANNEEMENVVQEDTKNNTTGKEVDFKSEDFKEKVIQKINFSTPYVAGIYKQGKFDRETIPNDLILKLAFIRWSDDEFEEKGEEQIQVATKEEIKEYVTDLFGTKIKYNDAPFMPISVGRFDSYTWINYVTYDNGKYAADYAVGGGGDRPFIHQEVEKAIEYEDKLEVYVKTVFVDIFNLSDTSKADFGYRIYKNYNFKTDEFEEHLIDSTNTEFYKGYNNGTFEGMNFHSQVLSNILDKIDSYVYVFEKDNTSGEYYLSEFRKAE